MSPAGEREGAAEARQARGELGLDPNGPLRDILRTVEEEAEVPVTVMELPDDLAGLYRRKFGEGFIFINGTDWPVRRRFTLAHEFGHHRLGHSTVIDRKEDIYGRTTDPQERQANAFAEEFLMPVTAVALWMSNHAAAGEIDLELVVRLARQFGVSAHAALIRLRNMPQIALKKRKAEALENAIAEREHRDLERSLNIGQFHDSLSLEVLHFDDLPRMPQEMVARAKRLLDAELLTVEEIAGHLRWTKETTERELTGRETSEAPPS